MFGGVGQEAEEDGQRLHSKPQSNILLVGTEVSHPHLLQWLIRWNSQQSLQLGLGHRLARDEAGQALLHCGGVEAGVSPVLPEDALLSQAGLALGRVIGLGLKHGGQASSV